MRQRGIAKKPTDKLKYPNNPKEGSKKREYQNEKQKEKPKMNKMVGEIQLNDNRLNTVVKSQSVRMDIKKRKQDLNIYSL